MTTTHFLIFLARKLALIAYAIGYEETGMEINQATVDYQEHQESHV